MLAAEVRGWLEEANPEAVFWDGLDEAVVGYGGAFNQQVVIYSRCMILYVLMRDNDWKWAEAYEWYEFNIKGGYLGEHTPIVIED